MLQITEADFSATEIEIINAIRKAVPKALGTKPYELRLCETEGGMPVKYIHRCLWTYSHILLWC